MSKTLTHDGIAFHFKSNGHPRRLWSWSDMPVKAQQDFDYLDEPERMNDDARFFEYRGSRYDLYEFTATPGEGAQGVIRGLGFEAYQTESAFSAVLAQRYGYDDVIVGYLHW